VKNKELRLIHKNILKDDFSYAKQYEKAFNILIYSEQNNIDLPMLFLLRHNIELLLKANIKYFLQSEKDNKILKNLGQTHNLTDLYKIFKKQRAKIIDIFPPDEHETKYMQRLQTLIHLINDIDNKQSIGLRYSHTKYTEEGEHSYEEKGKIIHIKKIKKLSKQVNIYLKNLKGFIEKKKDTN